MSEKDPLGILNDEGTNNDPLGILSQDDVKKKASPEELIASGISAVNNSKSPSDSIKKENSSVSKSIWPEQKSSSPSKKKNWLDEAVDKRKSDDITISRRISSSEIDQETGEGVYSEVPTFEAKGLIKNKYGSFGEAVLDGEKYYEAPSSNTYSESASFKSIGAQDSYLPLARGIDFWSETKKRGPIDNSFRILGGDPRANVFLPQEISKVLSDYETHLKRINPEKYNEVITKSNHSGKLFDIDDVYTYDQARNVWHVRPEFKSVENLIQTSPEDAKRLGNVAISSVGEDDQVNYLVEAVDHQGKLLTADFNARTNNGKKDVQYEDGTTALSRYKDAISELERVTNQITDNSDYSEGIKKNKKAAEKEQAEQKLADDQYEQYYKENPIQASIYYNMTRPLGKAVSSIPRKLFSVPSIIGIDLPEFESKVKEGKQLEKAIVGTDPTELKKDIFENPWNIIPNSVEMIADIYLMGKGGRALEGTGMATRPAFFTSTVMTTYSDVEQSTYDQLKAAGVSEKKAKEAAHWNGLFGSLFAAGFESIFPGMEKIIAGGAKKEAVKDITKTLLKGGTLKQAFSRAGKNYLKELPKEQVEELMTLFTDKMVNAYTNYKVGGDYLDADINASEIGETMIMTAIPGAFAEMKRFKTPNGLQRAALFEALVDPEKFSTDIGEALNNGIITDDEAKKMVADIEELRMVVRGVPELKLDSEKGMDLVLNLYKKKQIKEADKGAYVDEKFAGDREKVTADKIAEIDAEIDEIVTSDKKDPELKEVAVIPQAPKPGNKLFSTPDEKIAPLVQSYKTEKGITNDAGEPIKDIDVENSKKIADAFDEMEHRPDDPEVKEAYESMAKETLDQHKLLSDAGYTFEIYEGKGEPYANSDEMLDDLRKNKHLFVLSTENDFGQTPITDKQREENPLLRDSGVKDKNGKPLLFNDVFRGVHDAIGHGERGNSFGAKGEENAWDVHARMFSDKARRAMTTETRGQNSWVNFGKHLRNADGTIKKISAKEKPFAEQKIGLLPEWASTIGQGKKVVVESVEKPADKDAAVSWESEMTTRLDTTPVNEEKKKEIPVSEKTQAQIDNVKKALKVLSPDTNIVTHSTRESFEDAYLKEIEVSGGDVQDARENMAGVRALHNQDTKQIHIDMTRFKEGDNDLFHEGTHPILNIIEAVDPSMIEQLHDDLLAIEKELGIEGEYTEKFASLYEDSDQKMEAITEFIADVANGGIDLDKPTVFSKVKKFFKKLLSGIGIQIGNINDGAQLKALAKKIQKGFAEGSEIVLEDKYMSGLSAASNKAIQKKMESDDDDFWNVENFQEEQPEALADDLKKMSGDVAKHTEEKVVAGKLRPAMVISGMKNKQPVTHYSGDASMKALREHKPEMYINRALELSKSHLALGKVRKFNSNLTKDQKLKWADETFSKVQETIVSNLLLLHDSVPSYVRDISKLWYDGANIIDQELSNSYGISKEQAAAVIATQSPQTPWFDNLHIAHFLIDFNANNQDLVFDQKAFAYFEKNAEKYEAQKTYASVLEKSIGKKFSELNSFEKGIMSRYYFDFFFNRKAPHRVPTGVIFGDGNTQSSLGGYDRVAKAFSVLEDGSEKNISDNLGAALKVPSFYNNIISPADESSVTIDTHAIAAGYLLPLGSKSDIDKVKFDPGTFSVFKSAYDQAAKERGILPREMQSITWEAVRALFSPDLKKGVDIKETAEAIWNDYKTGKISIEEAQQKVIENGNKTAQPEWASHIDSLFKRGESSDYVRELPLIGRNKIPSGLRTGRTVDSGVPAVGRKGKGAQFKRSLVEDTPQEKFLTEDENGNYLFYHYSTEDLSKKGINPKSNKSSATGKDENFLSPISHYYTEPQSKESMIRGNFKHMVRIPKDQVYPFNSDPLNLLPAAEKEFRKQFPKAAFDVNKQLAFVLKEAEKKGYKMVISDWQKSMPLRGNSSMLLKPELIEKPSLMMGPNVIESLTGSEYKSNRRKKGPRAKRSSSDIPVNLQRGLKQSMKDAIKGARNVNSIVDAGLEYIRGTKWYATLSPNQIEDLEAQIIYDYTTILSGKKNKKELKEQEKITTKAYDFGAAEGSKNTAKKMLKEIESLKKKHAGDKKKLEKEIEIVKQKYANEGFDMGIAIGVKEGIDKGVKQNKKEEAKNKRDLANTIRDILRDPDVVSGLSFNQYKKLLNAAAKVKTEDDVFDFEMKLYETILTQKQRDDERGRRGEAFENRKAAKKAARSPKTLSSDKGILKEFSSLNPNKVSDIDKYNEMADAILSGVSGNRSIDNGEILNYIDKERKLIEAKLKAELLEENSDLVADGIIDDTMSLRDIQSILEDSEAIAEKNEIAAEKRKEKKDIRIKDLKAKINTKAAVLLEDVDVADLSELEKDVITAIENIDISNLSEDNLNIMNRVIDNILVNGSFSNAGDLIIINQIQKALKELKVELDALGIESLEFFINKDLEKGINGELNRLFKQGSIKIASTASFIDKIALSEKLAAVIRGVTGIQELYSGHAKVVTAMGEFNEAFRKQLDKDNQGYESQVRQALYSIVSQHYGGTQEDIASEFARNKKLAEDSAKKNAIESLHKIKDLGILSGEQLEKISNDLMEGKISSKDLVSKFSKYPEADFSVLEIYESLIAPAQNFDSVYDKLNNSEKRIIKFLRDNFSSIQESLFEASQIFGNEMPELLENYLPMVYRDAYYTSKIKGKESIEEQLSANNFIGGVINKSSAGSTINRTRASNSGEKKVVSTDFHYDMLRKFREAQYQIHTLGARKAIPKILNDKKIRSLLNTRNTELLYKYAVRSVQLQLNLLEGDDFATSLMNFVSKMARSGTRMALASPITGRIKQTVPVYLGAVIKLGKYSGLMHVSTNLPGDIFKHSNLPERKETKAGYKSDFYINEKELMAERNKIKKGILSVGNITDKWAEYITDKMMGSITRGDSKISERTWMAYYGKYRMKYDGVKKINWDAESKNPSKEASRYADQLVEKTQSTNSFSGLAQILAKTRTGWDLLRNIFVPFSTFVYNMRARIMTDVRQFRKQIMKGNYQLAGEAARDLGATIVEATTFASIQVSVGALVIFGAQQLLQFWGGYDESEAKAMAKQIDFEEALRRVSGTVISDLLLTGLPASELGGKKVINLLYKASTGDDKNLVYDKGGRQDESFADLMGTYGIYMDQVNDIVNDIDALWNGVDGWEKGGPEKKAVEAERELTAQEQDMYLLFLAHDILKFTGIGDQTISATINKARKAVESSIKDDMGKAIEMKMIKPGERFGKEENKGLSSGSLNGGSGALGGRSRGL